MTSVSLPAAAWSPQARAAAPRGGRRRRPPVRRLRRASATLPHDEDVPAVPDPQRGQGLGRRRTATSIVLFAVDPRGRRRARRRRSRTCSARSAGRASWPATGALGAHLRRLAAGAARRDARDRRARRCSGCGPRAWTRSPRCSPRSSSRWLIGIPLGIVGGPSRSAFAAFITPILDVMQIMPTFAYLAPMTLLFRIGVSSAAIATLIYAIPPAIRITALGIRAVPAATVEAARSLGSTRWQVLRKVQLPAGPPDDRHRRQPDDHDGALDGRDHRAHRRARARPDRPPRPPAGQRRAGLPRRAWPSSSWPSSSTA